MARHFLVHQVKHSFTVCTISLLVISRQHTFIGLIKAVQIEPHNSYEKLSELESDLRKPNPSFLREEQLALLERNPLGFWKAITGILFVANLVLLYLYVTHN
jgi:hypothetical protein